MGTAMAETTIREAVGVFHDAAALETAIDELSSAGFDRAEISLLAGEATVATKLGHLYDKVETLEDDPDVPRTAYVSKEAVGAAEGSIIGALSYVPALAAAGVVVASGGPLGAAIAAAALYGGSGAMIGAILARLVGDHHAAYLQEQLDKGGLLLWVRTRDAAHEARAVRILSKHAAYDIHIHDLPAEA